MITRLEIENFKAIRKLAINLGPLTVLVGPNDAGKTSILQALDVLGRTVAYPIAHSSPSVFGTSPDDYLADRDQSRPIRIAVHGDTTAPLEVGTYRYELEIGYHQQQLRVLKEELAWNGQHVYTGDLNADGRSDWTGETTLLYLRYRRSGGLYAAVLSDLASRYVAFNPQTLAAPCPLGAAFEADGSGLAALLHRMLNAPDRRPLEALDAGLRRLSPHVNNVAVDTQRTPGRVEALLALAPSRTGIYARDMSMGVLLATGYLALLHGTSSQRFLVEEPENGVHPRALLAIVDVLRELARSRRQVIMTTHSPILLNYMEPEEVVVVTRDVAGVHVKPIAETPHFDERTRDFDLGELWYAVGEDALVSNAS